MLLSCALKPSARFLFKGILHSLTFIIGILLVTGEPTLAQMPLESRSPINSAAVVEILLDGRLTGSGWFVSPDGLAITAAHNLKQAGKLEVLTKTDGRLKARRIAADLSHDLALLKVDRPGGFFPYLKLAQATPKLGQELHAFGSTLYRHDLFIPGWVANKDLQYEWNEENQCYTEVYYLSALTPEGLSGAPWVNSYGDVVGIQSGMVAWKGALMGIAFVAPGSAVERLLQSKKDVQFNAFGATLAEAWESPQSALPNDRRDGLLLTRIISGGLAEQFGLQKGDFITKVNGQRVLYRNQLLKIIRTADLVQGVELRILRNRNKKTVVLLDSSG